MISVIVPAHDESAVIERCLQALLQGARPDALEIVVVCNGCSDDTAARARRFGTPVRVLETPVASKSHALNLGDRSARGFPRFYVDADVCLPFASLERVAEVLCQGTILAAAPRLQVDLSDVSWAVRAYHAIWMRLPYVRQEMLGSGVYALSERGRRRFDEFPDIIADDEFVRFRFQPDEKASVADASFVVIPPRTLRALVHINVRRRAGDFEIRQRFPEAAQRHAARQRFELLGLTRRPGLWPALAVYVGVRGATLVAFAWRRRRGQHKRWARDDSSRRQEADGAFEPR